MIGKLSKKTVLAGLTRQELRILAASYSEFPWRGDQIYEALMHGASEIKSMNGLPAVFRQKLDADCETGVPKIKKALRSKLDETVKYLFEYPDGATVEAALMSYKYGRTLCVSTQVGCNMGCAFCASAIGGKLRDLNAGEILGQVYAAGRDCGGRIGGVVMMGMGEPLDNYENSVRFIGLVTSPEGLNISARRISLSTCGICDKITRLSQEKYDITLSVSLHASDDETRSRLMPVNRACGIDKLMRVCREYFDATGRRISFEYTLVPGVNDSEDDALRLARMLKRYFEGAPFHVNLIPVNAVEGKIGGAGRGEAQRFRRTLDRLGINATVRRTLGADINASCGQLRRSEEHNIKNEDAGGER